MLNGGSLNGARAPDVPGFGVRGDWSLASFNVTNVFHFSGGYELPFGKDKKYLSNTGKLENGFVGGWSINWITTLQGGQPLSLGCPTGTTTGTGCNDVTVPGQSPKLGIKVKAQCKRPFDSVLAWITRKPSNSLASWATTINR